ncbi:unnamed protein product [Urochloa decumbens]|uniref:Protein kinase domain-containing protein n=1 Tax=Urochloa decumbens TaxID=240449 RepID=A0ABC9B818_9POAL
MRSIPDLLAAEKLDKLFHTMAIQVHKLPLPGVPCLSTIISFILILLCCSLPKLCKCSGTDPDQLGNLTLSYTFDQLPGYLFVNNLLPCTEKDMVWGGPGSYLPFYSDLLEIKCLFVTLYSVSPSINGRMSFSIVFTMSIYEPNNLSDRRRQQVEEDCRLVFIIKPASGNNYESYNYLSDMTLTNACPIPSNPTPYNVAGCNVSAQISTLDRIAPAIGVQIGIAQTGNSSVANKYSVWIDYDHIEDRLLVYADAGEGTSKPANAIANEILSRPWMMDEPVSFGFFSSMGQLLQLHTWNSTTIKHLPSFCTRSISKELHRSQWAIAWSSVLGSAAAAAITATVVYLNSKYRRWKAEQEKLVKTMRSLPGVPTQVDYAEIRKATKHFHGTMKLGKGGFGAVYRCTLPAAASRTGLAMEVAVKKFLREVEHRRYDDFLAEVSIINRLRHKNIVPLIGWSYSKGEPILIYEYMTNGSLDQHLFLKNGTGSKQQQQQQEGASICKWQTRYSIAKDIAIGLHYVHHDHEPMVLHRDIKASNIMLDTTFRARLGDFGIASTVAVDRSSVTGIAGTWGYIAPEYAMTYRSTRQTDTYAFGVLILEVVTGKKNGDVPPDDDHITDWVWRLHKEGKLLEAVNDSLITAEDDKQDDVIEEAERLLLLGLACTNPNPSNRPSMVEAVQVVTKLAPPPDVPLERPTFMWPPEDWRLRNSVYSTALSDCDRSSGSTFEIVQVSQEHPPSCATAGHAFVDSTVASASLSLSDETEQRV